MDFVDEHDRAGELLDLLDHLLEALFEIAAIARAGKQRAHVEGEDRRLGENFGHLAFDDTLGQAFGDRRLADAGIADEQRIVLLPAAEDLDGAADLRLAADQRVDATLARLLIEVDAIGFERIGLLLVLFAPFDGRRIVVDTAHGARLRHAGTLGDAVADVVDRVVAGHLLLLQEIGGVALALGKDGNQHVGAGDLLAAGRLHMDDGALDDPLEAGGGFGILARAGRQIGQLRVDIFDQAAPQHVEIDVAGTHHRGGVLIVDQRQQQMFQRGIFLMALAGESQRLMKGLLKTAGE